MTGIAALPMYDWPALRGRTDQLWRGIGEELTARGIAAPHALTRATPLLDIWTAPDLLLAQTCGYPLVRHLKGRVRLVATPCYGVPGFADAHYSSMVVVRREAPVRHLAELAGAWAAVNSADSLSGYWALRALLAGHGPAEGIAGVTVTGSHRASLLAVADGRADLAAIDCIAWAIAARHLPEVTRAVRVIGRTAPAPGTPLITAAATPDAEVAAMREALAAVAARRDLAQVRADLMIESFEVLDEAAYAAVLDLEARALADPRWPQAETIAAEA